MRLFLALLACFMTIAVAAAQEYSPKSGETVLKLAIEGRGNIFIRLYPREAPKTTAHIVKLVKEGFYDGQRFHKVVRSPRPFLAQIGDPSSKNGIDGQNVGQGGSGAKIAFEDNGLSNDAAGVVGLANPNDKNAGDSQFYMLLAPSKFLDGSYTVFGKVVSGLDVLQKIERGDRLQSATILTG